MARLKSELRVSKIRDPTLPEVRTRFRTVKREGSTFVSRTMEFCRQIFRMGCPSARVQIPKITSRTNFLNAYT